MPRPLQAAGAVAALALTALGCGGGSPTRPATRPVSLEVTAPADAALTRGTAVEVSGRVSPTRARVLVAGRPADVTGGAFHATVALREGANLIDVGASAPRRTGAWVAVRVTRQTLVRVPDLVGALRDDAVNELEARGLRPQVSDQDGLLDRLLPGDQRVCATRPQAGAGLRSGATVALVVSKAC